MQQKDKSPFFVDSRGLCDANIKHKPTKKSTRVLKISYNNCYANADLRIASMGQCEWVRRKTTDTSINMMNIIILKYTLCVFGLSPPLLFFFCISSDTREKTCAQFERFIFVTFKITNRSLLQKWRRLTTTRTPSKVR